jgi:hypothetical protein
MLRYYLILAAILVIGILIGQLLPPKPVTTAVEPTAGPGAEPAAPFTPLQPGEVETLAALQRQLRQERLAREQLAGQLETLQLRIEELESGNRVTALVPAGSDTPAPARTRATKPRTSVQTLIEAGIEPELANRIQARLDEIDLQQLYLRDQATREGWLNQPRYHKERRKHLDAVTELRGEVGDDAYDRMLYTLGRANRVVVRDTMQNSPAEQYGLLSGDRIIEYDGRRIFTGNELNALVSGGDAAALTLVRVERDGRLLDIYLPRGPLGIRVSSARALPPAE